MELLIMKTHQLPRKKQGFSMIELLMVLSIIAILGVLSATNFTSTVNAQNLSSATSVFEDTLNNARKQAISMNREVEFRIRTDAGTTTPFTSYEVYIADQYGIVANGNQAQKFRRLPTGFTFASDSRSTLLSSNPNGSSTETLTSGGTATYYCFHFRPDGSTDLPLKTTGGLPWYITILTPAASSSSTSPMQTSVVIDPTTGALDLYRL